MSILLHNVASHTSMVFNLVRRADTKLTQEQHLFRISDWLLMVIVFVAIWRHKSGSNDGLHWARGSALSEVPWLRKFTAGFSLMGKGEGVLGFFAYLPCLRVLELAWREDPAGEREPGNYGDPFGVQMYNDEMRMKELNNGRMAMISVLGIFAAELATERMPLSSSGSELFEVSILYRISLALCAMGTV